MKVEQETNLPGLGLDELIGPLGWRRVSSLALGLLGVSVFRIEFLPLQL